MRGKIIESDYHPGCDSWILKQTKYGMFSGRAELHPDDEDIDNSFDGCRIAEFRADLQAYQEKAKWMRQRAIGARILFETNKELILDANIEDELEKTVNMLEQQADAAREYYERMKSYEPIFIKNILNQRREIRHKVKD